MGTQHVVSSAREFAMRTHESTVPGDEAYALYLDEVAVLVRSYGDLHQAVAYLHRVLDGGHCSLEQVEAEFGPAIARCVASVADEAANDAKEARRLTYAKLRQIGADDDRAPALVVRAAARLVEVQNDFLGERRGNLRKYRRDYRDFRAAVYRPGLADELWDELASYAAM